MTVITGTFTGTGQSAWVPLTGYFRVMLSGISASTVVLQQRNRGGTAYPVKTITADMNDLGFEPEHGVEYQFDCIIFGSGTITYRLGRE